MPQKEGRDWRVFFASVFFVLGFSTVFSILGILLQTTLSGSGAAVQAWLSRIGGVLIIFFGLFLLGLVRIPYLQKDHKFRVTRKFRSSYVAAFVFGAAFAVGWTPCVGAVLGAILTLATVQPSSALLLMLSYSLGLGFPFLLLGFFTNQMQGFIERAGPWINGLNKVFAVILIIVGVFLFTNNLTLLADFPAAMDLVVAVDAGLSSGGQVNLGIAFLAGVVSFLSPCVLPLMPGFLAYLAAIAVRREDAGAKTENAIR